MERGRKTQYPGGVGWFAAEKGLRLAEADLAERTTGSLQCSADLGFHYCIRGYPDAMFDGARLRQQHLTLTLGEPMEM